MNCLHPYRLIYKFNSNTVPVETNIVLPNDKVTYDVGSELSLECEVSGYPKPSVVWFKDGRQIQTSDRIHITGTGGASVGMI